MADAGADISCHRSKLVAELRGVDLDYVATVCDNAHEPCPLFPEKAKVVHLGFDDPLRLAFGVKTEGERLTVYRRVPDEIRAFMEDTANLARPT